MRVSWNYFGCDREQKESIQRAWQEGWQGLQAELATFGINSSRLQLTVSRRDMCPAWNLQAALHVRGQTLISLAEQDDGTAGIHDLLADLRGKLGELRPGSVQSLARPRDLDRLTSFLEAWRKSGRADVFLGFITPLVGSLRPYVRRELRIRELASGMRAALDTPDEVLDELLVRAYEQFPLRPRQTALELWLLGLAEQILEEVFAGTGLESLNDWIEQPDAEPIDSRHTVWTEWATDQERLERGDLLPGLAATDVWDDLDVETKQTELYQLLKDVPRHKRQCLMLHTVDGFTIAEIADFQDRSEEQVRVDIDAARWALEQQFRDSRWLDDIEERLDLSRRRRSNAR